MAQIKITAKKADLKGIGIRTQTAFKTKDGKRASIEPVVGKDTVKWIVDDTDYNREVFERDMEPSGLFACEVINQETPKPFDKDAEVSALKKQLKEAEAEIKALEAELEKAKAKKE
jgi:hypothetical protein